MKGNFMKYKDFDVTNKTYCFKFNETNCSKCHSGICGVENSSLNELINFKEKLRSKNDINRCKIIASKLINNNIPSNVYIYFYKQCFHYSFSDGQHRSCCAAKLNLKDKKVFLKAYISIQDSLCPYCSLKNKVEFLENYSDNISINSRELEDIKIKLKKDFKLWSL